MSHQGLIRSNQNSFSVVYRVVDMAIVMLTLLLAVQMYGVQLSSLYLMPGLIGMVSFLLIAESVELYRSWRASSALRMVTITSAVWVSVCFAILLLGFFAKVSESVSRVVMGSWMLCTLILLCGWRLALRQLLFALRARGYNSRRVAIVGINDSAVRMREQIKRYPNLGYQFQGFFDDRHADRVAEDYPEAVLQGSIDELITRTQQGEYDVIFIALPLKAQKRIADILDRCGDTTASVHLIPDFFTYNLLHARLAEVGSMQTLSVYESPIFGINDVLKRLFDIVFSFSVLAVIAIPMLLIALGVKLSSPGPVIFKQVRYGLDGRRILVWKFRSMTAMDNGNVVRQATKGDARITPFGAFIRRTSLDELPQFINVLQGRMSVVGPRPHAVAHNEEYRKLIPYYMLRHKVKPGITGWAQINGFRGETDTLDKMSGRVDFDLDYIRNWSLWMDVKIIFLTLFKGFVGSHVH
ncbi:undecaprenyl-phosphate glucose phosphotransferase [Thalassolituus pacificus]|uniref:Undecaprenyl-phosphate glucose phosphotransferase n=1 Tax=Thalassolituus pacificus TaxID=2975440 RepID=A0A9X3ATF1_9GAMM|nr:undecaprenyl-phosphate glucose phosphotransferase [Thalassolituus pacificus]MCT7360093.1 undecaprenyl-phosphate glucose phosphotransferase [Thalassolituus pacificus]